MPSGAPDGSILIETSIDRKQAEKDFKALTKSAQQTGDKIEKAFSGTEDALEDIEKAAGDAAQGVEDMGDAAKEAGEQSKKGFDSAKDSAEGTSKAVDHMNDSLKKVDSAEIEALTKRIDNVNAQIEVQQRLLDGLREKYENVALKQGEDSPQALKLQSQILKAEAAIEKMIGTSDRLAAEIRDMDAGMGEAAQGVREFASEAGDAEESTINFRDMVKGMFSSLGINADAAIDTVGDAIDRYEDALADAEGKTDAKSQLIGSLIEGGITAGVTGALAAVAKISLAVSEQADEIEIQADRMQAALNLSETEAEAASDTARSVYQKGLLGMQESEQAVISVMKRLKVSGQEAEAVTNAASAVAVGHGQDIQEVIRTASILMDTYGLSASQAVDLIGYAFDTSAGEFDDLLDAMAEYAPRAEEIGYSATGMVSAISGAAEAGAVSADKSMDIIKEAYNKAAGATDEYKAALHDLGLSSDTTIARLTGGGEAARLEMDRVVEKLAGVRNESERSRLASILLGSQWEDTSIDIAVAVTSAEDSVADFTGAAEDDFRTLTANNATAVEQMKRKWETDFPELKETLIRLFFNPIFSLIDSVKKGAADLQKITGGTSLSGYSTGTSSASPGLHAVAENGAELIDTGNSLLLAASPSVYAFSGGETVYTAAQTSRALQQLEDAVAVESARRSHQAGALSAYLPGGQTHAPAQISETNYTFAPGSVVIDPHGIKDLEGFAQVLERERNRRQDTQMGVSMRQRY